MFAPEVAVANIFVLLLENIWQWLGFSQKDAAKRLVEKCLIEKTDYKIFAPQLGGAKKLLEKKIIENTDCKPVFKKSIQTQCNLSKFMSQQPK